MDLPVDIEAQLFEIFDHYWLGAVQLASEDQCPGQLELQLQLGHSLREWSHFLLRDGTYFRARWHAGVLQVEELPEDERSKAHKRLLLAWGASDSQVRGS